MTGPQQKKPASGRYDTKPVRFAKSDRPLVAVLGPTNTGKTHYAMDRMAAHQSGMMGFPLRLLARENYDKLVARKGAGQVALVTGEEKIIPRNPRYWICTIESMPLDISVEFLAIDEIQLCADPDRGYVFTDRLLHARGVAETVFLGAMTIRGVIEQLFPDTQFLTRPRLSTLDYVTPKKLSRIPPRSAVVAFSATEVYRIAELVRQQRGGTAVVLGALSPRTRNAQVEMYQAGEVDYLVATDAIGMGLNMDIDHVTFGGLRKFDGRHARGLNAQEIGQIAGRAGRHMNDGTFTTAAEIGELDEETVEAVENHRYNPLETLFWRNRDLDFRTSHHLLRSLDRNPGHPELLRAREAEDHVSLRLLTKVPEINDAARSPAAVRLLWDVCQIPDFRKTFTDAHGNMIARVFRDLIGKGEINGDWVESQVARLDRVDGDIDTLVNRIANIRTWTYISHHAGWMSRSAYWQERSRSIEDRLSDALHDRLTTQFVDRRSAIVMRRIKEGVAIEGTIQDDGNVVIEGEFVGTLNGFDFRADPSLTGSDSKPMLGAAKKVAKTEIDRRLAQLMSDNDGAFCFGEDGGVQWRGTTVAHLVASDDLLSPVIRFKVPEMLTPEEAGAVEKRLNAWIAAHLKNAFGFHHALKEGEAFDQLSPTARGLAYQLWEGLGVLERGPVREMIRALTPEDRKALRALRVRFGRRYLWTTTLRSDRSKRALTTLKTAFPDEARYAIASGMVEISGGRDRVLTADLDIIERALSRIWLQAEQPKKPAAPKEAPASAPPPASEEKAENEATAENEAKAEGEVEPTPVEPEAAAPAPEVVAVTETAETPAAETPAAETPAAEIAPLADAETTANAAPAEEANAPADAEAPADTKAEEPTKPKGPTQVELDASRDEELLKICDGDERLVKAIWFLPEARGKRPRQQGQNRGQARGQNRNQTQSQADGVTGAGDSKDKGGERRSDKPRNNQNRDGAPNDRKRQDGKRGDGNRPEGKRPDGKRAPRKPSGAQRENRPNQQSFGSIDANSPFAALAGLKFDNAPKSGGKGKGKGKGK